MGIRLNLYASDITKLPEPRPAPHDSLTPQLEFSIQIDQAGIELSYNSSKARVSYEDFLDLAKQISVTTRIDWEYSKDSKVESTFRPLNRIIKCIDSTPSYQLFLAGFHIAETIGLLSLRDVSIESIPDSFRYLVGNVPWPAGKKGSLFFLREGEVQDQEIQKELFTNGKIFSCQLVCGDDSHSSIHELKLFVPYATPIGFGTKVGENTKVEWRRIVDFVRKHGGGGAQ